MLWTLQKSFRKWSLMGFLIRNLQTCKLQLWALRTFKTPEITSLVVFVCSEQCPRGSLQNNCSKQQLKTSRKACKCAWNGLPRGCFTSWRTSKGRNQNFERQNKVSAMPMPMSVSMLMRYFEMIQENYGKLFRCKNSGTENRVSALFLEYS